MRNCEMSAVLPTPGPPSMLTRCESTGPVDEREGIGCDGELFGDIGLVARLLLRERLRRNESPRLITPATIKFIFVENVNKMNIL